MKKKEEEKIRCIICNKDKKNEEILLTGKEKNKKICICRKCSMVIM